MDDHTERDMHGVLALEQVGETVWRSVKPDRNLGGEVFGGQYLALSIAAAIRSAPGRLPHAMTSYFLAGAKAEQPVDYVVETTRDGRSFAHRRVTAMQNGIEAFRAEVSFHEQEDGQPSHSITPPPMPPIEELLSLAQSVRAKAAQLDPVTVRRILNREHFSMHLRDPEEGLGKRGERPDVAAWVRPNPPQTPGDAEGYYATIAYISDSCSNFASRIMHSENLFDGSMLSVSLNHGIWFHAPPVPLDQVLYTMESPYAGGGLGFNRGMMFDLEGRVLASVVQDALIRRR